MKYATLSCVVLSALVLGCDGRLPKPDVKSSAVSSPDNTGINARDRDGANKTPIDQNENRDDVKLTADIRKRVMGERLSVDAENVKIITQDGKVTLRGPVKSADEKEKIESIAKELAGPDNVENLLEVETEK